MPESPNPVFSVTALFAERDARRVREKEEEEQLKRKHEEELAQFKSRLETFQLTEAKVRAVHGYAEGAVIVEMAHARQPHGRKLFCLPDPPPSSGTELGNFISWANEDPSRLQQPAVDGMFCTWPRSIRAAV